MMPLKRCRRPAVRSRVHVPVRAASMAFVRVCGVYILQTEAAHPALTESAQASESHIKPESRSSKRCPNIHKSPVCVATRTLSESATEFYESSNRRATRKRVRRQAAHEVRPFMQWYLLSRVSTHVHVRSPTHPHAHPSTRLLLTQRSDRQ